MTLFMPSTVMDEVESGLNKTRGAYPFVAELRLKDRKVEITQKDKYIVCSLRMSSLYTMSVSFHCPFL